MIQSMGRIYYEYHDANMSIKSTFRIQLYGTGGPYWLSTEMEAVLIQHSTGYSETQVYGVWTLYHGAIKDRNNAVMYWPQGTMKARSRVALLKGPCDGIALKVRSVDKLNITCA